MTRIHSATTVAAAALLLALAGCSASSPAPSSLADAETPSSEAGYPVSIENCGRTLTFDAAPEHVVSLWQAPTEMMLALGLGDHLVARAGDYAAYPASLAEEAEEIPSIGSAMGWPSKRRCCSARVPISCLVSRWKATRSTRPRDMRRWSRSKISGAQVYGANICDADGGDAIAMTLDTPIDTLRDLGVIFGVSDRAEELIANLKQDKQTVIDAVEGKDTVEVAFYNGGEGPLIVLAGGIYDDAIETGRRPKRVPCGLRLRSARRTSPLQTRRSSSSEPSRNRTTTPSAPTLSTHSPTFQRCRPGISWRSPSMTPTHP